MALLGLCFIASCAVSVGFFAGAFFSGSMVENAPTEIRPEDRYMTITLDRGEYRRLS